MKTLKPPSTIERACRCPSESPSTGWSVRARFGSPPDDDDDTEVVEPTGRFSPEAIFWCRGDRIGSELNTNRADPIPRMYRRYRLTQADRGADRRLVRNVYIADGSSKAPVVIWQKVLEFTGVENVSGDQWPMTCRKFHRIYKSRPMSLTVDLGNPFYYRDYQCRWKPSKSIQSILLKHKWVTGVDALIYWLHGILVLKESDNRRVAISMGHDTSSYNSRHLLEFCVRRSRLPIDLQFPRGFMIDQPDGLLRSSLDGPDAIRLRLNGQSIGWCSKCTSGAAYDTFSRRCGTDCEMVDHDNPLCVECAPGMEGLAQCYGSGPTCEKRIWRRKFHTKCELGRPFDERWRYVLCGICYPGTMTMTSPARDVAWPDELLLCYDCVESNGVPDHRDRPLICVTHHYPWTKIVKLGPGITVLV